MHRNTLLWSDLKRVPPSFPRLLRALAGLMALGALTAGPASAAQPTQADKQAEQLAATVCASCHGTDGRSSVASFPDLAAQRPDYLEAQIKAFRDQSRADPDAQAYMWGMAAQVNDAVAHALAEHYAAQHAAAGVRGDPRLLAQGRQIYQRGVPALGVPPCSACHGDQAQGMGAMPRLAGQHAPYIVKQILVIQRVLREAPVMHGVIRDLTRPQIEAVATYLQSIGPGA